MEAITNTRNEAYQTKLEKEAVKRRIEQQQELERTRA
jgi:uncharacterized protein with NAD-binding domain and iron-sulfur cluster